ncbi:hypothetical protein SBA4_2110002 [Candidatus Sulfopaludibacter sp. SbA4]|nr:hypothetical protein SBA4_2110002 [Candidatus Sulfopaludibacter sp. SbA4]
MPLFAESSLFWTLTGVGLDLGLQRAAKIWECCSTRQAYGIPQDLTHPGAVARHSHRIVYFTLVSTYPRKARDFRNPAQFAGRLTG